jgi:photosystem II stability/assembly factor-like uncharacterized protein
MNKKLLFTCCLLFITIIFLNGSFGINSIIQNSFNLHEVLTSVEGKGKNKKSRERGAPGFEKRYFEQWHYPDGANIEPEKYRDIWEDVQLMPKESKVTAPDWQNIGPYGALTTRNCLYSGRILDINVNSNGRLMIGAASGGLWKTYTSQPVNMTSTLNTQVVSAFDVQPGDTNTIIMGTGEDYVRGGTGLYRTSNGGLNWTLISMGANTPQHFHLLRFSPIIPNLVHAATSSGYYRSNDGGLSWTQILPGNAVTDIAFHPTDPNTLFCGRWDNGNGAGGLYKSINAGASWTKLTTGNIPTANVGKTLVSISAQNPNFIYCMMSKYDTDELLGVYRTSDGGSNWSNVSPPEDILDGLGWYLGALGASPSNPNICLVAGIWLWRTTNGGQNWHEINYFNDTTAKIHVDFHSIIWHPSGNTVWVGHDGGISNSTDQGATYNTERNIFPITQYMNFDVSQSNSNYVFGGSRDNAFTGTTNYGNSWNYMFNGGADGGGAAIDPFNPPEIYGTLGALSGNWIFGRFYSTNFGTDWVQINSGVNPSQHFYTKIRTDNIAPVVVFSNADNFLYYSTNKGTNWLKRNTSAFSVSVTNFSVRQYAVNSEPLVYVCLNSSQSGQQLKFQSGNGLFAERSSGLPDSLSVRTVTLHPSDSNVAYAVMNGLKDGKKVYMTTNQGLNWTNISGNLPNAPAGDLVVHSTVDEILYLGGEMGFFKTTDGGSTWFRWNNGVPEAVIVTEMKSFINNGEFYVIASTYGNSIWTREETDNPLYVGNNNTPSTYSLSQNYPNPFNPETTIEFSIPEDANVQLLVYNISGQLVKTVLNSRFDAGSHSVNFAGKDLSSGVYFYKLITPNYSDVRKMIIIK